MPRTEVTVWIYDCDDPDHGDRPELEALEVYLGDTMGSAELVVLGSVDADTTARRWGWEVNEASVLCPVCAEARATRAARSVRSASSQCGAIAPDDPARRATCARPKGHDITREGHSAPLGVHEDGTWEWYHWPETNEVRS